MLTNRSIPDATVMPVLAYPAVADAVAWLCTAFGFAERLRIGDHRAQLHVGDGAVVVAQGDAGSGARLLVRVADADAHCARAIAAGARVVQPPTDHAYGERQYTVIDPAGHSWTFTQTIADADPASWGGVLVPPSA